MKIYYLGPKGSFSYLLAREAFDEKNLVACSNFEEVSTKVLADSDSLGVLPISNSITSNIHENIDLLLSKNLKITGEAYLKIKLNLIAQKGTALSQIKEVASHPKALLQCSDFITQHELLTRGVDSTASAQELLIHGKTELAALGSSYLIDSNKLEIIQEDVGNVKNNKTRFLYVKNQSGNEEPQVNKLTALFKISHEPGSLVKVLSGLSAQGANLTKIESRPIPGTHWEYLFWIDLETEEPLQCQRALEDSTSHLEILGTYATGKTY